MDNTIYNNKQSKKTVQKKKSTIDTGSEFAAEFGEGLYGAQARLAYEEKHENKNHQSSK